LAISRWTSRTKSRQHWDHPLAYDRAAPLWLILCVTDQRGIFSDSLDLLASVNVAIEPYERVVVY
jgi:hypothetical protein